jgi:large subunit ribosomal protein L13
MKTVSAKKADVDAKRRWVLVDVEGMVLGRVASVIAGILRGKQNVAYTPHVDMGDFVVVINADKVKLTGKKETKKVYNRHTGWAGGVVSLTAEELRETKPEELLKQAVWGMIPKGPLGRHMYGKLKVYAGAEHPHTAQKPERLALN